MARVALSKAGDGGELRAHLMELAGEELTLQELVSRLEPILEQARALIGDGAREPEGEAAAAPGADDGAPEARAASPEPAPDAARARRPKLRGRDRLAADARGALRELRALREALESERATAVAKRYEGVCAEPEALAGRLRRLRELDGDAYDGYLELLDELAEARRIEPFMKEYGSSRGAGGALEARVAEILRLEPGLTRAQAVVRAYQSDPDIPEVL